MILGWQTQHKCTKYPTHHHTYKEGPQSRANRRMKPRHRRIIKRAHSPVSLQKSVGKGGRVGPAEHQVRSNLDGFLAPSALEGRLPPPSQRRLSTFPHLSQPEIDLFTIYKGLHTPSQWIHSLLLSYTRRKSSSSAPLVSLE